VPLAVERRAADLVHDVMAQAERVVERLRQA
jgi:hypothetical protein